MSEEQSNFKVTDRRLFNADGSPRDIPADERPQEPPSLSSTAAEQPADDIIDATYSETAPDVTADSGSIPAEEIPGADDPASFTNFIMSIASNAASSLGMMEHPVTRKREVDLELGKHWIDILGMLEQKTQNNLLPQEQQIVESLLADLRMQYVSLTNAVASKARGFSSRDITGG
ncbi:MAG TPA: DUF1844 domain-containing protein [Pyrinomonadaceae bacterium]|nr:DUF1844 domain-containing protein [Pyrinomonadaceae bacterium]